VIWNAGVAALPEDRRREYGVRTQIAWIRQAVGVGIGEESDEHRVVIGRAEGVGCVAIGRVVEVIVEDARLIRIDIPYGRSTHEGE